MIGAGITTATVMDMSGVMWLTLPGQNHWFTDGHQSCEVRLSRRQPFPLCVWWQHDLPSEVSYSKSRIFPSTYRE